MGCLIAHYTLDGNAADISGHGYGGTLHGTTPAANRFGNPASALLFNGTSDYIELPTDFDLQQRTICAWVKVNSYSTNMGLVFSTDHAAMVYGGTGLNTWNNSGTNEIVVGVGANSIASPNTLTGVWYHMALSVSTSWVKYYLNGSLVDSLPNNSFTHSTGGPTNAHLGCNRLISRFYNGVMDDVMIFDCALDASTIDSIYNGVETCLLADYPLDGNAYDIGGFGYNGTLHGATLVPGHNGIPNTALHFNGTSDYIDLGSDFDIPVKTISLWVKLDTFSSDMGLIYSSDHDLTQYGGTGINSTSSGGNNQLVVGVGVNSIFSPEKSINTWYHLALTAGPVWLKFYINGVLFDSIVNNSVSHSTGGCSAAHLACNRLHTRFLKGSIDDVKIFKCELSHDEIAQLLLSTDMPLAGTSTMSVYPNPAEDKITLEVPAFKGCAKASIYNMQGQLILQKTITGEKTEMELNGCASGIYVLTLSDGINTSVKKFIKQ